MLYALAGGDWRRPCRALSRIRRRKTQCVRSAAWHPIGGITRRSIPKSWPTPRGSRPTICRAWPARVSTIRFYDTLEDFYLAEALEYITAWRQATADNPAGICGPIGPTEQLPLVARLVNELELDLRHAHFWGMDEWAIDGREVGEDFPLELRQGRQGSVLQPHRAPSCGCRRRICTFPPPGRRRYRPATIRSAAW